MNSSFRVHSELIVALKKILSYRNIVKETLLSTARGALFDQGLEYHVTVNKHSDWIMLLTGDRSIKHVTRQFELERVCAPIQQV